MQTSQAKDRRVNFLGCPLDLLTSDRLLQEVTQNIDTRAGARVIQFVNANKVAQVSDDAEMGRIMWRTDYSLADGQPLLPMARLLGMRIPERIDGIGLMHKLLRLANDRGYSVFLLGARQEVVEACVEKIRRDYPNVRIAGYRNGYFKMENAHEVVAQVQAAQPDLLFLGFGSPMKEKFADKYADELGASVIQGVGGSFDVMAGLVKRAPIWVQRIGMEWLFRVVQEPRRMFWRYTKTNAQCIKAFFRALLTPAEQRSRKPSEAEYADIPMQTPSGL
jgi:N-acetylglucosaminyldiphosphoundecaprenol N-acetyl-beta-D-mannosaminyltransferase